MQRVLILLGLIVLCACSLQATTSNSTEAIISPVPADSNLCEQKGYTWNPDSTCTYEEASERYHIKLEYPIELTPSLLIENAIDSYLADYRASFMQAVETGEQSGAASPWFYEIVFTIYRHSPSIISVQFAELSFLGGAHHNIALKSFTFDLAANRVLAFEDLFRDNANILAVVMPMARAELVEVMNAKGILVDYGDMMLLSGTDELHDFRNFALTETHLLISFETYQVAAYTAGQQDIMIPLSDLDGVLREL